MSAKRVVLTGDMTYADALAAFAAAWPHVPVVWFRAEPAYYKDGRPTADELAPGPDEPLGRGRGDEVVLRGGTTGQGVQWAMMSRFGLETEVRGVGVRGVWLTTLDQADARLAAAG